MWTVTIVRFQALKPPRSGTTSALRLQATQDGSVNSLKNAPPADVYAVGPVSNGPSQAREG